MLHSGEQSAVRRKTKGDSDGKMFLACLLKMEDVLRATSPVTSREFGPVTAAP